MIEPDFGDDDDLFAGGWDDEDYDEQPVEPPPPEPKPTRKSRRGPLRPKSRSKPANKPRKRPTGRRPRPQVQPYEESEETHDNGFASMDPFGNGMTGAAAQMAQDQLRRKYKDFVHQHSFLSFDNYRPLFAVSDVYVYKKLKHIFFPFLNKDWKRKSSRGGGTIYELPRDDDNAPDGYITLMAFITFIIVVSISVGVFEPDTFSPDVMAAKVSSGIGVMVVETVILKSFYYFMDISETGPSWLEQLCYSAYKLVLVVVNLLVYFFWPSLNFYRLIAILSGFSAAFFMVKTLQPYFELQDHDTNKPFLIFVTILQVLLVILLGSFSGTMNPDDIIAATTTTTTTTTTLAASIAPDS